MGEFEEKLNAILSNPDELQKITNLASQLMGGGAPAEQGQDGSAASQPVPQIPGMDAELLSRAASLMSKMNGAGSEKTSLLKAIAPYLSPERKNKLEKAIRFAKLAKVARELFGELGGAENV